MSILQIKGVDTSIYAAGRFGSFLFGAQNLGRRVFQLVMQTWFTILCCRQFTAILLFLECQRHQNNCFIGMGESRPVALHLVILNVWKPSLAYESCPLSELPVLSRELLFKPSRSHTAQIQFLWEEFALYQIHIEFPSITFHWSELLNSSSGEIHQVNLSLHYIVYVFFLLDDLLSQWFFLYFGPLLWWCWLIESKLCLKMIVLLEDVVWIFVSC